MVFRRRAWVFIHPMDAIVAAASPPPAAETEPAFTHQQIRSVVIGIVLCIFLAAIDQTVVIPAVPSIAADLHDFSHLAWIVSAYLLTSTAATPVYGKLSDIYGRRALLLPAIVLFVAASLLCGAARTMAELIGARALQGLGGGGLMAMAQAAVADVVAPRERGRYQAYMASAWAVASIAGPVLGGWMTDHLSWRYIFWINLPVGAAAYILSSRALRLLRVRRQAVRIDYAGAALLTALITALLLVMSWGGTAYAWLSAPVASLSAASVVLLALLVWRERVAPDPLLPPRLFANRVFVRGVVISLLCAAGIFAASFLLPLFFQLIRGADASTSGTLMVPFLGFNVVGAYGAGQLARRSGRAKPILLVALSLACVGFVLLSTMAPGQSHWWSVLFMAVLGCGIGGSMPTTLVIVQNAAERRDVGAATGGLLFLRSMGGALGSTLAGALLASVFAARLRALGVTQAIGLGALHGAGGRHLLLDPATRASAVVALTGGFHAAFLASTALAAFAVLVCAGLPDLILRSGNTPSRR